MQGQMKRVIRELKAAKKSEHLADKGITVELLGEGEDINKWSVSIPAEAFGEHILASDLQNHPKSNAIDLEVTFTPQGFDDPPFVRVVRPRFAFHTGNSQP
jgi:hypothetical protein